MTVEGRVQGVGFRFTTADIARRFPVTGYVMNCPDGTVELLAEGEELALVQFRAAVLESPVARHVVREQTRWMPATGAYRRFEIRHA